MNLAVDGAPRQGALTARVLLVDPAFTGDRLGHHWRLNTGYADLFGADRCWFAVGPAAGAGHGVDPGRVIPAFSVSPYDAAEIQRLGRAGRWLQALAYRDNTFAPRQFRALLQSLLRGRRTGERPTPEPRAAVTPYYRPELERLIDTAGFGPEDHLVFPSLDARLGRALLEILAERGLEALPALHLRLMYTETTGSAGALDYQGLVERIAATGQLGDRLSLHCETQAHAERLSRRLGAPVGVAPFPAAALPPPTGDDRLTVGYFGEARAEKGFDLLEPIVAAFEQRHPDLADRVAWRFHAGGETIEAAAARDVVRAAPRAVGDVRYRFGALSPQAYERMRADADIVLAPQDPDVYAERGSGVAQEALAGARPLVCLAGSSLAQEPGAAVAAADSVDGLADALASIIRTPGPWFDQARAGAAAFAARLAGSDLVRICRRNPAKVCDRPVALVVGPWWPQGGSGRLMALQAETLTDLGYQVARVHLARPGLAAETVLGRALKGEDRDCHAVASFVVAAGSDDRWVGRPAPVSLTRLCRSGRVGLVLTNFVQTADWAEALPLDAKTRRILETHELRLDPATGEQLAEPPTPPTDQDAVIYVNAEEQAFWTAAGAARGKLIVPPLDDRGPTALGAEPPDFDLLFVGSDHARNRAALDRLLTEILVGPEAEELRLLVVGDLAAPAVERPRTHRVGRIDDLEAAYASARVVVAPWAPGGGLPSKVLGALARGAPLVADRQAVAFLKDPTPFAAQNAVDFRNRVLLAIRDDRHRAALAEASAGAWAELAAPGAYAERWRGLLAELNALPDCASRSDANRV